MFSKKNLHQPPPSLLLNVTRSLLGFHRTGIHDVVKGKTSDGHEERRHVISETVPTMWGFTKDINISCVVRVVEPDMRLQMIGNTNAGLRINLTLTLVDYRDGMMLIDIVEYTARRFRVNLALGIAVKAHKIILDRLKVHAENKKGKQ